ncbi:hypothetical protein [Prevotella dentasini]|uniref:hypothetical protein n=1 Tax=Prevotella dentasini TaxID=589537 RepID=UPI0004698A43|nr:hypothetical protein [Prevotella dentasini]
MPILKRITDSIFHVYERRNLTPWEHRPDTTLPIYGVYHAMLDTGWERLVGRQIDNLKKSGLLDATSTFYISCIASNLQDVERLRSMIDSDKTEIVSCLTDPKRYEYPALEFIKSLSEREDCIVYYFHTKGISYQSLDSSDQSFLSFRRKIEAWREMLEYFIFDKWQVAVNALTNGYDTYGCYRWPPRNYTMYSGSFWWARSEHIRQLPDFRPPVIATNRFYSETWLFERKHRQFSAFDSIADLYFVRIPRSVYTDGTPCLRDKIGFSLMYNLRKIEKHIFHYNYKQRCQKKFQKLKQSI